MTSVLKKYANENGWCLKKGDRTERTHTFLELGSLAVPLEKYKIFLDLYNQDIRNGVKMGLVERLSDPFKFFLEIDYYSTTPDTVEELEEMLVDAIKGVCEFFPKLGATKKVGLITFTPPEKVKKNDLDLYKTGIHIYFPKIIVTKSDAVVIVQQLAHKFKEEYEEVDYNKWTDVFDRSAYKNGALRMMGSRKYKDCECKKQPMACGECTNRRKDIGRLYKVYKMFNHLGEELDQTIIAYKNDPYRKLSIRADHTKPDVITKPDWFDESAVGIYRKKDYVESGEDAIGMAGTKDVELSTSQKSAISLMVSRIRKAHPKYFKTAKIISIKRLGTTYVISTDCKMCLNLASEHNSNHIYFVINRNGIFQKCHCRCETQRVSGVKCKDFESPIVEHDQKTMAVLFGSNQTVPVVAQTTGDLALMLQRIRSKR